MVWARFVAITVFPVTIFLFGTTPSEAGKRPIYQDDTCRQHTSILERQQGIPSHLLTAISLAETGRWDPERRAMFAWPWTVTSQGKGKYYDSKVEAIDAVKKLQAAGVRSIDVGCMQVNLYYHPRAFKTLDDAFNPELNIGYASHFLKSLFENTKSWKQAAAHYHSTNPSKNIRYQKKIMKLWSGVGGNIALLNLDRNQPARDLTDNAQQALAQQDLLNARFRARLNAERSLRLPEKRKSHLDAWRAAGNRQTLSSQFAARQRADRERRQRVNTNSNALQFAAKRRQQLSAWRAKRAALDREAAQAKAVQAR